MRYEGPSIDDTTARHDARGGESAENRTRDERKLYGDPCHEVATGRDEQTLYGEPQHETRQNDEDPDLLFARLRTESLAGPGASTSRDSPTASATER